MTVSKKINLGKHLVRSGWPKTLKADCDYFNITFVDLANESNLSRYRIMSISNSTITYKSRCEKMNELTIMTSAFNRIIADRNRKPDKNAWEW